MKIEMNKPLSAFKHNDTINMMVNLAFKAGIERGLMMKATTEKEIKEHEENIKDYNLLCGHAQAILSGSYQAAIQKLENVEGIKNEIHG